MLILVEVQLPNEQRVQIRNQGQSQKTILIPTTEEEEQPHANNEQ
jgi:virulence-associated protein VagC